MKLFSYIIAILTVILITIYLFLFTSLGHGYLVPKVENTIIKETEFKNVKVTSFNLSPSTLRANILIDDSKVSIDTKFSLINQTVDGNFDVNIKDLSKFNNLTKQPLNGPLTTQGKLVSSNEEVFINGIATVAKANIDYELKIVGTNIKDVKFKVKELETYNLLNTIEKPKYASSTIDINGHIKTLKPLEGNINTTISNGVLNKAVLEKLVNMTLPNKTTFNGNIKTILNDNIVSNSINLNTSLGNINTKQTNFNIKKSALKSDYTVTIPNLEKLKFITKQPLRGSSKIDGEVTFDEKLFATFNVNQFGGLIQGILENKILNVNATSLQSLELLHTLYYPEIFTSNMNAKLTYNIAKKSGESKLTMSNGQFLSNQAMSIIKELTKKDLTHEIYENTTINTDINNNTLKSNILMKSKKSEIKSNNMLINTTNNTIDANVNISYEERGIDVRLKGDIKNPKVNVKANEALKNKAKDELKKLIDKKLKDKLDDNVRNLLKGLF